MPVAHFTDIAVSRLNTPGTYYDDTTPAFGIRIGKNRKTWFVIRGSERLRTTIGRYPALSLADARKEAKHLLLEEPVKADRTTFAEAYEQFKASLTTKKPRTQKGYKRLIDKHFMPKLGMKKLPDITYEQVIEATAKLPAGEQAHALAVARILFRWCIRPPRRYLKHSPLEGIQIAPSNKRKRILKPEELKAVWKAAEAQEYPHGPIVKLLILTGQRRTETANLRWEWIDTKERTITLPDWLTKNRKEHTFPYGDLVARLLEIIPRRNSTSLLFPSRVSDERPLSGFSKLKLEMTDGVPGWRLHDLRRTYRTLHAQFGTSPQIGERLINHAAAVQTEVEAIYDRWTYLPEMRKAVATFEERFLELLARE
jgi:integrase